MLIGFHMTRLGKYYLLLGLAQTAHSVEEMLSRLYDFFWVISGRLHEMLGWYPQFRWNADVFAAGNMLVIAAMLAIVPFVEQRRRWALVLAGIAGVIEMLNGINHLTEAIVFRGYVPGAITAPLLLVIAALLLRELRKVWRAGRAAPS